MARFMVMVNKATGNSDTWLEIDMDVEEIIEPENH